MYFGGVSGVVVFEPDFSLVKSNSNSLRISKISWHDGNAGETKHRILSANIRPAIRLSPKDKYFTVFYSSRDMQPGAVLNTEYRLVGLHSDWQLNGTQNYVQLSNLNPGDYELQIRSVTDASTLDTPILSIPVFVATPPGKTWWAYTLYILIAVGLGFILFREYFNRIHIRKKLKLEREHSEKLEEINRSKATFFTNITHEFKTPLTLIKGPAEEIESGASDPKIRKFAQLISRNANAILDLVTQLLELSKLEANIERGQFHRIELVGPFTAWVKRFESMARQKQIRLSTETDQATLYMDCDPVKLETICNNLLSNAIKFTPAGGEVKANLKLLLTEHSKPEVQIRISDTGPGIDEEEQLKIFDRYYQGKNSLLGGTGIGLSFVKELVRLHNGEVELSSEPGKGSVFTVRIPVHHEKASAVKDSTNQVILHGLPHQDITSEISENWEPVHGSIDQEAYILVAEDHADIANLVKETLSPHYQVKIAEDGRKAHELAIENIPDLVITDVMMPVMDGFRLTRLMKNDVHTNHIPIIMLTAKDGLDARLEGRIHGADLYLNKPFSPKELLLSVNNLLRLRSNLMQHASKDVKQDFRTLNLATDLDKAFYSRFISELENRMSATSLSVSEMVEVMNMSRTQLHRKLKAITGQSYSEIVRSIRLQKALSLLRHSGMNVTEVAYEVGYSAPSYFSESFKEYFGYSPSEAMS
jgi:signal transduction histidine kinase/DNA-binding response OmpR family regulator